MPTPNFIKIGCGPILYGSTDNFFVLDFYVNPNETSESIYKDIKSRLNKYNLKVENLTAYGADNASVKYGQYKSVFKNLQYENGSIIKANCLCHVIHNAAKYSFMQFPIDIDNLVTKIYSHFPFQQKDSIL